MKNWGLISLMAVVLTGCDYVEEGIQFSTRGQAERQSNDRDSRYLGVSHKVMLATEREELVQFKARVSKDGTEADAKLYARCAAAQYTLDRGWEYVRHVRTNVSKKGGVWIADAVYTHAYTLPQGMRTIDAVFVVPACVEKGIPTV